ncbi:MAG: hypothetical protein KAJ19_23835 [Gammaproteobacteria bacterium]|nr:hypothetical protein [Gammaproteobacteria bacterium]
MIDENVTFILFKYTSNKLSRGSGKKILSICNECGKERLIQYKDYRNLCFKCSHETKKYKLKQSESSKGRHHTEETKLKMSNLKKGDKNSQWRGGRKLSYARRHTKRRQLFGFIPHNIPHKNFHGHHIDFNHVIFIPKELHISISHSVINNKNMDIINDAVCDWYLKDQII